MRRSAEGILHRVVVEIDGKADGIFSKLSTYNLADMLGMRQYDDRDEVSEFWEDAVRYLPDPYRTGKVDYDISTESWFTDLGLEMYRKNISYIIEQLYDSNTIKTINDTPTGTIVYQDEYQVLFRKDY